MNNKPTILITGMAPHSRASEFVQLSGELAELRDKGYDLVQLTRHALQFTEYFDIAAAHDGFAVYPQGKSCSFMLVTTKPINAEPKAVL